MFRKRKLIATVLFIALCVFTWLFVNRPRLTDLSIYAPSDSLAFIEANDLASVLKGVEETASWRALAPSLGAPEKLSPNRFWVSLARWTGIGSANSVIFARSQVAIVLSGAQAVQADATLTITPLTTFIIETHTSQWRMRLTVERYLEDLARRTYTNPVFVRKKVDNFDIDQWSSADSSRRIVFTFSDTAVIVGNDEESVLRSVRSRTNHSLSLNGAPEFHETRKRIGASTAAVAAYVSTTGAKSLLQAFWLERNRTSADVVTEARIFADIIGGVVKNVAWSASFHDGFVEDRYSIQLVEGVADKLHRSITPNRGPELSNLALVPSTAHSFSLYQFQDTSSLWSDLNAALSSHTDVIGSMAVRAMLRSILKPYGIADPERFVHAVGTRFYTVRLTENDPAVLVAEALDRPALRNIALLRLSRNPNIEKLGNAELLLSTTDNWAAAFTDSHFLIGPADSVRRCLNADLERQSISTSDSFRKSQVLVDITLPIFSLSFTNDQAPAISLVEVFSNRQRSAFAANAPEIEKSARALPLAVSAAILKDSRLEWTSRSSFGLGGSIAAQFFPEGFR